MLGRWVMKLERRWLVWTACLALALAAWMLVTLALVWFSLEPTPQHELADWLGSGWMLLSLCWLLAVISVAFGARHWLKRLTAVTGLLLDETRILLTAASPQRVRADVVAPGNLGGATANQLAGAIHALAAQRDRLRESLAEQVAQASGRLQQEKNQLAALMAELAQSVVVCNLDGRILLYNRRALLQFRAMSGSAALTGGAELIGIGRSIYAVINRPLLAHALESVRQQIARGATSASAQFVTTTTAGQLLRVNMTPVRGDAQPDPATVTVPAHAVGESRLTGFVLMLVNVTRSFEEEALRGQWLQAHAEGSRAAWVCLQQAMDRLSVVDLEPSLRDSALDVMRGEMAAMSARIAALSQYAAQSLATRWPMEDMLASDLLRAAQRHMALHCQLSLVTQAEADAFWIKVDSFSLIQALTHLACRLADELGLQSLQLRLAKGEDRAQLDLLWAAHPVNTETVMAWEHEPMHFGDQRTPLSVRDVVSRHAGDMWFERDRVRHEDFFRFSLPLVVLADPLEANELLPTESRPEFYDFDLFQHNEQDQALDDRRLCDLSYTVFDTETTGLNPAGGDEIIQIGAARIVNGKLLRQEFFDHLIDPARTIPAASTRVHGITQAMVEGKPRIGDVLPAFHAFAHDTVLVAHNAAFDMRFLQLKEAATGMVFQQPVLDTLLLSAVVHPNQSSHRLDAIAQRLNIPLHGRHTALGDAMATADIWLRLIPLLNQMGITSLRQAREAAQKTYYARLTY